MSADRFASIDKTGSDCHSSSNRCHLGGGQADGTSAFEAILREHGRSLRAYLVGRLHCPEDVEDALMHTVYKAWRARQSFRGEVPDKTWLFRIALRVAIDMRRVSSRRRAEPVGGLSEIDVLAGCPESPLTPEGALVEAGEFAELHEAIARLAPEQRLLVQLHYFDGREYTEISSLLGIPVSSVRGRLHRVRALLRDRLTETRTRSLA
jgi:RNA polymerase sigma-70 factor, ECF subfamily